jgi:pyrroloquinoline quinone biosynthesis protein B
VIVTVLGSGSNGGVPQWDCPCPNCTRARSDPSLRRTRSSIAVSLDGDRHVLIDASPDLKQQLEGVKLIPRPRRSAWAARESRIDSVLLTHGHGDHCVGLFEFSTGKCFDTPVYGSPDLIRFLFGTKEQGQFFSFLGRLARDYVNPRELKEETSIELLGGLKASGFEILHTERLPDGSCFPTRTYGYEIEVDGGRIVYAPDLERLTDEVLRRVEGADVFMLDTTFWWNDELARISGLGKTSYDLGHVPVEESMKILKGLDVGRIVYTHVNHTNPLLDPDQGMMEKVKKAGFEVAEDGMAMEL